MKRVKFNSFYVSPIFRRLVASVEISQPSKEFPGAIESWVYSFYADIPGCMETVLNLLEIESFEKQS